MKIGDTNDTKKMGFTGHSNDETIFSGVETLSIVTA